MYSTFHYLLISSLLFFLVFGGLYFILWLYYEIYWKINKIKRYRIVTKEIDGFRKKEFIYVIQKLEFKYFTVFWSEDYLTGGLPEFQEYCYSCKDKHALEHQLDILNEKKLKIIERIN